MGRRILKAVFLILCAGTITAYADNYRSTNNSVKSNLEKTRILNSEKIKTLLLAHAKDPQNTIINNRLGYLYYLIGKYKNSEYHYQKSISCNAKNIEARLGLYLLRMIDKDYAGAAACCRQIKTIDKLNYYGNLYLVNALMAQYKYAEAEAVCKEMLTFYPCDTTFLSLLKTNYTYLKQTVKAQHIQSCIDILK